MLWSSELIGAPTLEHARGMCVGSRRFKAESAGGAQQRLFLLKIHNRMESHPLGLDWVVGNVSWMEVGKEKLDALQLEGEWKGGGVPARSRRLRAAACLGFEGETIKQLPDFKRLNEKAPYFFSLRPLTTNLEPPGRRGPPCLELWNCKSGPSAFFQTLHLCPKPQGSLHPSQKTGMHGSGA